MTAPWAGRSGHTTVIDAAGAIYVIGGGIFNGTSTIVFNDVWVSPDGGARPDSRRGWSGMGGYYLGYYLGDLGVPGGCLPWGTLRVLD